LRNAFRVAILFILCFSVFLAGEARAITFASSLSSDDWPMLHHDIGHSSYTPGPYSQASVFAIQWFHATGDFMRSSPAVVSGVVYVGSSSGYVTAYDALTGNLIWTYNAGKIGAGVVSSPAVVSGVVYVCSDDGHLYSLDALTGKQVWNYTGTSAVSSPVVANGVVYVGANGSVLAVNASSGIKIWNTTIAYCYGSPALFGNFVYVSSSGGAYLGNNYVYALDAATGSILWTYPIGKGLDSDPTVVNGVVYVGFGVSIEANNPLFYGSVYALDALSGTKIWNFTISVKGSDVSTSPAVANGLVYVCSIDGSVYALSASTGFQIWNYSTVTVPLPSSNSMDCSPAVAGSLVIVGSGNGYIYAFDASTGTKIWSYSLNSPGTALRVNSAVVSGGLLYAGTDGYRSVSNFFAFNITSSTSGPTLTIAPSPSTTPSPVSTTATASSASLSTESPSPLQTPGTSTMPPSSSTSPSPTIPEFSSWLIFALVATSILAIAIFVRRSHSYFLPS